jgi:cytochrome c biogenesis protein CcmG/thiol:disulfide interchange protein DsbE
MSTDSQKPTARPRRLMVLLPLLIFMGLAGLFLAQLLSGRDLTAVPSALIGQMAPETDLPPLEGMLVNVWASWCAPCREEHPVLLELSKDQRFSIAGLNYKDKPENARRFLGDLGSPYKAIGVDQNGRTAIDWGVYGVPETFLLGKDGKVAFKHVGPLSPEAVSTTLMPEIEKALAAQ